VTEAERPSRRAAAGEGERLGASGGELGVWRGWSGSGVREGRGRGGGFIAGWRSGGGGHGQWLSGRAVVATNGGAGGDVGAVTSAGGRQQTCGTREKRAGGVSCACAFLPGMLGFSVVAGLGLLLGLGREGGSPGVGFSWAEVGPEVVHRLGHKSNMARPCIRKKRGGASLAR
jgi:hypothetical protein